MGTATAGWPLNTTYFAEGANGEALVLKVGFPHPEQITEMIALAEYAGRGTPGFVDASEELGATLMQRILPGDRFREWGDSIERSRVPMPLIGELPIPMSAAEGLPSFDQWVSKAFREFRERYGESHAYFTHVSAAESAWRDLRSRHPDNWLLHGDLHHENIIRDAVRGWIAIDPKGVIGPRTMEAGRFLHNFLEDEIEGVAHFADAEIDALCEVLEVRLDSFADTLGWPRADLVLANYIDCVLSFCWTLNGDSTYKDFQPVEASRRMLERAD